MQIRKAPTWSTVGVADDESCGHTTSSCGEDMPEVVFEDATVEPRRCYHDTTRRFIYEYRPNAANCFVSCCHSSSNIRHDFFNNLMKPYDSGPACHDGPKLDWGKMPEFLQDELDAIAAVVRQPGVRERYKQLAVTVISVLNRVFGKANISLKGGPGSMQTGNFEDGPTLTIIGRPKDKVDLERFKWWEEADMWGHVCTDDHDDPFDDIHDHLLSLKSKKSCCKNTVLHRDIRAEFSSINFAMDCSQFRTHIFSFILIGRFARFMYWECSGSGIFTHRFDYTESPELLLEFFVRFSALDRRQRGYDKSVRDASPEEIQTANEYFRSFQYGWMNGQVTWHKILVPGLNSKKPESVHSFIIPHQRYRPARYFSSQRPSQVKTWPAYTSDLSQKTHTVMLKDGWIPSTFASECEFNIYLATKGISGPEFPIICAGSRESSLSVIFGRNSNSLYRCERQAICTNFIPISQSSDAYSICSALRQSIHVFSKVYSADGPTHRDIQCSEVTLGSSNACLSGWEKSQCIPTNLRNREKKQKWELKHHQRTLLPKFTSVNCLSSHENSHGVLDDLESISNIMMWHLVVVTSDKDILRQGDDYYDFTHQRFCESFNDTVQEFKEIVSQKTRFNRNVSLRVSGPLKKLAGEVNHLFAARYQSDPLGGAEDLKLKLHIQRSIEKDIRLWLENSKYDIR